MLFFYRIFQIFANHVGINLCCCDIGMPQHFLYAAQVGAAAQKVAEQDAQIAELQAQIAELSKKRGPGRPPKSAEA